MGVFAFTKLTNLRNNIVELNQFQLRFQEVPCCVNIFLPMCRRKAFITIDRISSFSRQWDRRVHNCNSPTSVWLVRNNLSIEFGNKEIAHLTLNTRGLVHIPSFHLQIYGKLPQPVLYYHGYERTRDKLLLVPKLNK